MQPGDSLWSISNRYGVAIDVIVEANLLQDIPYLIPGQALVIPTQGQIYTVQPGDTLWSISRKFNVTVSSIVALNNISNPDLIYPGMKILIPGAGDAFGEIEVNGYIEPISVELDKRIVDDVGQYLTYISPFSYRVNRDGSLIALKDETILEQSARHNIAPLLVVTNFRNGNFDADLVHDLLTDNNAINNFIVNVINVIKNKNYYGLNIDFERIPPEDRQLYNDFLRKVTQRLHREGYIVSTALAPKPYDIKVGAWHGAHDYQAHGNIVDFVIIMTYEWGWSGGPPMAVAPIDEVRKVINYAVSVIPPQKIMMGMPLYGYDWPLPYTPGGGWARRVSPQEALQIAAKYGVYINYDTTAQSPYFYYTDTSGIQHVVWFEDARSVMAKFRLVNQYGLRGVSYWVLGQSFPQNWEVLDAMFKIKKLR